MSFACINNEGSDHIFALSRKKVTNSIQRHFSRWKRRQFTIDSARGILHAYKENGLESATFDLVTANVYIDIETSATLDTNEDDRKYLIISENSIEMLVKFENVASMYAWEKHLKDVAEQKRQVRCLELANSLEILCMFMLHLVSVFISSYNLFKPLEADGVYYLLASSCARSGVYATYESFESPLIIFRY